MQIYRDLVLAFRDLEIDGSRPAIVHSSLSAFGAVNGGAEAVVGALFEHFETVVMPTFTYKTMLVPETGPPNNAVQYGSMSDANKMAEFYYPEMPADKLMGVIPETLRQHHTAFRTRHPILSFSGVNAEEILETQTIKEPFAPVAALADQDALVVLMGVSHTANTSIHLGEMLAKRKTFVRWALVTDMIAECVRFPSCSDGFEAIQPHIAQFLQETQVGDTQVQIISLVELVETVRVLIEADPLFLLCESAECPRCMAVRAEVTGKI
ncbi:MAG: AAC(3) family N-acetyltransferase [Chloroflexota bacterium]